MKLRPIGLPVACLCLSAWVAIALAVASYVEYRERDLWGFRAAAVAAGICWSSATAALWVTGRSGNSVHAVSGILIASGLRFAVPLAAGIVLTATRTELADAGVFRWILVFYLWTLAAETTLSVWLDRNRDHGPARAS